MTPTSFVIPAFLIIHTFFAITKFFARFLLVKYLNRRKPCTMFDTLLDHLELDLRAALGTCVSNFVATARTRLEGAHADVVKERAKGLAEVAAERAKALAEVDARRADLGREVAAMHTHRDAQEGHVELNIGGYRFETSVQTLRRVQHTFFDAYFSGRYQQDVCNDGSIFVDRDGEHFGHVLEYMRDGVVSVADVGARPSVSLLRALKREFGFYCIELNQDSPEEPDHFETVLVMGGIDHDNAALSRMELYDKDSEDWISVAAMGTARSSFGACVVAGEAYVIGGRDSDYASLSSVEKYSPSRDAWSVVAALPQKRAHSAAVSMGSAIYVLGGVVGDNYDISASVLKLDVAKGTWSEVASMPEARMVCVACVVGTDIYMFGGEDEEEDWQATVFKYDTEGNAWEEIAPMPATEIGHSVSVIDGLIYIIGAGDESRDVLRFEPATGVWSTLASTIHGRWRAASYVLDGCLYAAGGTASPSHEERYDAKTNTWTEVAGLLESGHSCGAVTIGRTEDTEEQDIFDSLIAKAVREGQ
jgi:hypothetical protein